MGIRRSPRLQSRNGETKERNKRVIKKIELPKKRKVILKKKIKPILNENPRRSTRIRKRNSFGTGAEKNKVNQQSIQTLTTLKIEPCEVKLEVIDYLIEKLNLEIHDSKSNVLEDISDKSVEKQEIVQEIIMEEVPVSEELRDDTHSLSKETSTEVEQREEEGNQIAEALFQEKEDIVRKMTDKLNEYKFQNEIDFDEIDKIANSFNEENILCDDWETNNSSNFNYKNVIINDVFFDNTKEYNYKSCFKDRDTLMAAFDRHCGQISNVTCPYDISETPEAEKVKRFYRKNISDPSLHSWYQYNVVSSKRFSNKEP